MNQYLEIGDAVDSIIKKFGIKRGASLIKDMAQMLIKNDPDHFKYMAVKISVMEVFRIRSEKHLFDCKQDKHKYARMTMYTILSKEIGMGSRDIMRTLQLSHNYPVLRDVNAMLMYLQKPEHSPNGLVEKYHCATALYINYVRNIDKLIN